LAGYLPETRKPYAHQKPLGYAVRPGTALLGYELGRGEGGERIKVLGGVHDRRAAAEQGSKEDITIGLHLSDAQAC